MYDSVTVSEIPPTAYAAAGYVGGHWATWTELKAKFPLKKLLSIAVNASEDAACLDVENGDAVPADVPAWVQRQQRRGIKRPVVYSSVSEWPAIFSVLKAHGIKRSQIRVWTAHYTYKPHRCSPLCGFGFWTRADATQFTDHALGKNLDASLCAPDFL